MFNFNKLTPILAILSLALILIASGSCKKDDNNMNNEADSGFYEDFSGSTANNWVSGEGEWTVQNGVYHVKSDNINLRASTCYFDQDFTDFVLEVKARKTKGSACNVGVIFRGDPDTLTPEGNWYNSYKLIICSDKRWSLGKLVDKEWTALKEGPADDLIAGDSTWNVVKVVCKGNQMEVSFNGTSQGTFTDSSFTEGKIGISMYDVLFNGEGEFDYVRVSTIVNKDAIIPSFPPVGEKSYFESTGEGDCPGCSED